MLQKKKSLLHIYFICFFKTFWPYHKTVGILVHSQGSNLSPLHWKRGFLTTRLSGKKVKSFSRVPLFVTPQTIAYQAPPSMGFSRQEYWSGLLFPSPGDLPNPGIKPRSLALQADALLSEPVRKSQVNSFKRFIYARLLPVLQLLCYIVLFMWQTRTGLLIVIRSTILFKSL